MFQARDCRGSADLGYLLINTIGPVILQEQLVEPLGAGHLRGYRLMYPLVSRNSYAILSLRLMDEGLGRLVERRQLLNLPD